MSLMELKVAHSYEIEFLLIVNRLRIRVDRCDRSRNRYITFLDRMIVKKELTLRAIKAHHHL